MEKLDVPMAFHIRISGIFVVDPPTPSIPLRVVHDFQTVGGTVKAMKSLGFMDWSHVVVSWLIQVGPVNVGGNPNEKKTWKHS